MANKTITALTPLKHKMAQVFLAPALKLVECVCELFVPILVSLIIDNALTEGASHYLDAGYAFGLVGLIFLLAFIGFACTMLTQYVACKVSSHYGYELRNLLFKKTASLSPSDLDSFGRSKALNLTGSDAMAAQNGVMMFMRLLARAPFLLIGSIVASFLLSVTGGFIVLGAMVLVAIAITAVVLLTPKQYGKLQAELDEIGIRGEDALTGRRLIRAFETQEKQKEDFSSAALSYRRRALLLVKINSLTNPLTFAFANAGVLLVLYALGVKGQGNMPFSVGVGVALINYLTQSLAAFLQFTRLLSTLSKAYASKKRIDSFLALSPSMEDGKEEEKRGDAPYVFALSSLSKGWGGEENVLEDISLAIKKGERIGVFGATGSGKSVLMRLLCREYDPTGGEIAYEGRPLSDYRLSFLKKEISYCGADSGFFRGSIRENIALGKDISDEAILSSLEKAQAKDFVLAYSDGLDHEVEEKGSNFSGGQKQRLLLARSFLFDAPVQIYDDALSALDAKTEKNVREELFKSEGKTIFLVSQKVGSLSSCDRVIVLQNGRVFAFDTHESLLKSCPFYRDVYDIQRRQV